MILPPAPKEIRFVPIRKAALRFLGMLMPKGVPASELPNGYSSRQINRIGYNAHQTVRPGSRIYSTAIPAGTIYASLDHRQQEILVWLIGATVYVSNKTMTTFTAVLNITATDPAAEASDIVAFGKDAYLFNSAGLYRIVLDGAFYHMYQINAENPSVIITDQAETVANTFGYYVIYSALRITGHGNRDRTTTTATETQELEWESGTSKTESVEKDYGTVYFSDGIGVTLANPHVVGTLTLPDGVRHATHFGLYRTKNIGLASGGTSPSVDGVGNLADLVVWDCDVPVTKPMIINITANPLSTIFTVDPGSVELERNDVGCVVYDESGNSGTISTYIDGTHGSFVAGHTLATGAPIGVAIGGGRVGSYSQTGMTITRTSGAQFDASDVGLPLFRADGKVSYVAAFLTADTATAAEAEDWGSMPCSFKPLVGNFSRSVNLVTPDSRPGDGRISLDDRILAEQPLYIPSRFFDPVPSGACGAIDAGFMLVAARNASDYYYSDLGDEIYNVGYYQRIHQTSKVQSKIRKIVTNGGVAGILCSNKTYTVALNTSTDVGRKSAGEYVSKLQIPFCVNEDVGVFHWRTLRMVRPGLWLALTNEPAIRYFDGQKWSSEDYAVDQATGLGAVACEITQIDHQYDVVAGYSPSDGYILWYWKMVEDDSDNIILDTGATTLAGDDIWLDTGGTTLTGDDIVDDTGGTI